MAGYAIDIVDVFAERPMAGNQLAVVHGAADLTDEQMQAIALETNFSETTFILNRESGRARVRIFTPTRELPFAGHPTLGTAWVLTEGEGEVTLELGVGPVDVRFADGVGWMVPPEVTFEGEISPATVAALVGLSEAELAADLPVRLAQVGPQFVLIPLRDLAALKAASMDAALRSELLEQGVAAWSAFVFTEEAYDETAHFAARMFFDGGGIREDPATGSANSAFAAYLRRERGNIGSVVVDQGVEINRPSRLYLQVDDVLQVGGKVQHVLQGEIFVN